MAGCLNSNRLLTNHSGGNWVPRYPAPITE